ncbi:MAG: LytTR family DNA-binding domain-containing protein [Chitinophagaceae bacterium]
MTVLIIEDELIAARRLKKMLLTLRPDVVVAGMLSSISEARQWFRENPMPQLLLLDIELSDGQSFELFDQVPVTCPVIFITAYDEYALRAFKVNSIDFLIKPLREEELNRSLLKLDAMRTALQPVSSQLLAPLIEWVQQQHQPPPFRERFLVKTGQRFHSIETRDIAWFVAAEKLVSLVTLLGQHYFIDYSLDDLEKMLHPRQFYRANRQYLISPVAVESLHQGFNGKYALRLRGQPPVDTTVSREKVADFKEWLGG